MDFITDKSQPHLSLTMKAQITRQTTG